MVTATLATLPDRAEQLRITVDSLLPQVDEVCIYLNGHDETPGWILDNQKIRSKISDNRHGDAGKFLFEVRDGWHLTCDDDIIYPKNYRKKIIEGARKYNTVVSFHGRTLKKPPIPNYYWRSSKFYTHCKKELKRDQPIHIPGTGTMCYHTGWLRFSEKDFPKPNMADVWVGIKCQKLKRRVVALAHPGGWIGVQKVNGTIFRSRPRHVTKIVNEHEWILR